jgi:hypothetical protein
MIIPLFYLYNMKKLTFLLALAISTGVMAQKPFTYSDLLKSGTELTNSDSINISIEMQNKKPVDSITIKNLFPPLYQQPGGFWKNTSYWLAGKITSFNNYNLVLIYQENEGKDSSHLRSVYLVTLKKEGAFLYNLAAAWKRDRSASKSSVGEAWLYLKNAKLVIKSKVRTGDKESESRSEYRIDESGNFVSQPKGAN